MIFPFSRPNLGMEWMRWQAALTFKPLGALSLAKGATIGMAVPPKILSVSVQHPGNGMEIQGEDIWLTVAGQRHLVQKGEPGAAPNWHPVGSSAEWRQQAQSMGWLVQMLGHPDWLEATALFESWCRQASRLSSSQLRAQAYVPDVVGQRLVSILQVLGRLPQEHDVKLYHWLRKQAYTDAQFLARAGFGGLTGWSRLSVLEGQCLFAGSFDGLRSWQARLLPELIAEASNQWNNMGAHCSGDVAVSLASLISLQNAYNGVETLHAPTSKQQDQLERLRGRLVAAAAVLRQLLPDTDLSTVQRLPHFSGFPVPSVKAVRSILDSIDGGQILALATQDEGHLPWAKATAIQDQAHGPVGRGLQDVTTVFLGGAPEIKAGHLGQPTAYHAGLGALEVQTEAGPLLGGCGMKADLTRWASSLRSTAAFSMLQISDQGAIQFGGRSSLPAIEAGVELDAQLSRRNVSGSHVLEFSHNGFSRKNVDAQSYRRIRLSDDAARIDGEDRLDLKSAQIDATADAAVLRFQLAAGVQVRPTSPTRLELEQEGAHVGQRVWEFVLTSGRFAIEDGMWIASDGTGHSAPNLAIHAPIRDGLCLIFWRLVRLTPSKNGATEQ